MFLCLSFVHHKYLVVSIGCKCNDYTHTHTHTHQFWNPCQRIAPIPQPRIQPLVHSSAARFSFSSRDSSRPHLRVNIHDLSRQQCLTDSSADEGTNSRITTNIGGSEPAVFEYETIDEATRRRRRISSSSEPHRHDCSGAHTIPRPATNISAAESEFTFNNQFAVPADGFTLKRSGLAGQKRALLKRKRAKRKIEPQQQAHLYSAEDPPTAGRV